MRPKYFWCFWERFCSLDKRDRQDLSHPSLHHFLCSQVCCPALQWPACKMKTRLKELQSSWVSYGWTTRAGFLLMKEKWTPVSSSHCRHILCCFLPSSFPAAPTTQVILLVRFRTLVRSSSSWLQCLQCEDTDSGQSWAMYPTAEWLHLCLPEGTQGRWGWGDAAASQHYKQKRRQKPQAHSAWEQSRVERATRCLIEPHSFSSNFAFRPRIELHCLLTPCGVGRWGGGTASFWEGTRAFWEEGHIPGRAEYHGECPYSEARQDLGCSFFLLLLPQTLELLHLCFLYLSVVPNTKSSIQ